MSGKNGTAPVTLPGALAIGLRGVGGAVMAAAVGWWWLVFAPLITGDYLSLPQAARCLTSRDDICALAESLCQSTHPFGVTRYSADLFWIGLALLGLGLMLPAAREKPLS